MFQVFRVKKWNAFELRLLCANPKNRSFLAKIKIFAALDRLHYQADPKWLTNRWPFSDAKKNIPDKPIIPLVLLVFLRVFISQVNN